MRTFHLCVVFILAAVFSFACAQPISALQSQQAVARFLATGDLLDINTATPQQLRALPGFGDAYVRRVITGRPYTAKNQLVTRGILPRSAYAAISSRIVARHPSKRP